MKDTIIAFLFVLSSMVAIASAATQHELFNYNPVANPDAIVTNGNARFTVLTDRLIRMEYSENAQFEDRATIAFVNRNLPVPKFTHAVDGEDLVITTSKVQLVYKIGNAFSAETLNVTSTDSTSAFKDWQYGMANPTNLLGTIRTLDLLGPISLNCTEIAGKMVHAESLHCEWGLVSRAGWSVVNDTSNYALSGSDWWDGPNTDAEDLYLFAHGLDYKGALSDFVQVAGKIAMVPRYANGIMWTRWFDLNNYDVKKIVADYETRSIPLDVFILDMDWHTKEGWGGYSFDERLFPVPQHTLGWLHAKGLHSAANVHDDDGVRPNENEYRSMAQALGMDPNSGATIPFNMINSTVAYALEDIVLKAVEDQGMDFWWIDWQQGGTKGGCAGGKQNPTIWLNHLRGTDHIRRNESTRGLVLSRFGGLGNHRYQIGFSGDVAIVNWEDLAYQPYFSLTASNVAFGFWSHDLVGPPASSGHELHTRWLQWGAYSAVFRTHDRGMSGGSCANQNPNACGIVEVWNVPKRYFEANRAAMTAREELIPYLYNATRAAYDTGLSLLRPMYYEFPESNMAYAATPTGDFAQYFLGDHMFVAPVVTPSLTSTSMANQSIWVPPGWWFEKDTGILVNGGEDGKVIVKSVDLSEVPVFIRAGAIIPTIPVRPGSTIGLAAKQYSELVFTVYPGAAEYSTVLYEDNGATTDYVNGAYANTNLYYKSQSGSFSFTALTKGSYAEMPSQRSYTVRIVSSWTPSSVTINGQSISYSMAGGANTWHYDGLEATLVIQSGQLDTHVQLNIDVKFDVSEGFPPSMQGEFKHAILAKVNLDESRVTLGAHTTQGGKLQAAASVPELLEYLAGVNATAFNEQVSAYSGMYTAAINEVKGMQNVDATRLAYSVALLESALN